MSHPHKTQDQLNAAILNWTHELAPHGIFTTDTDLHITTWNHWLENHSRLRADHVLGRHLIELFPSLAERRLDDYFTDALRGEVKVLSRALHGYLIPFPPSTPQTGFDHMQQSARIAPLLLEGKVCGTITVVEDVTEREWHAATLRASEERFRAVADTVPDIIYTADAEGRYDFLNHRFYEVSGVPPHSAFGFGWLQVVHPDDLERVKTIWQRSVETGEPYQAEFRIRDQAGAFRWFISRAWAVSDAQSRISRWFGASTDIHELKHAEHALAEQRRLLKSVTDNASVALFMMDDRQHCVFMNPAAENLTGFTLEETRDKPLHDVIHHTRPDGSHYPLQDCPIDRAFPQQSQIRGEDTFVHKDGHFFEVAFTASPICDAASKPIGTIIEVQDITDRKRTERALATAQEALRQHAENLEREVDERTARLRETITHLETFSYTVAHDLRAPIRAMESYAGILFEELQSGLNDEQQKMLRNIARAARHLDALTRDLLSYTRISTQDVRLEPLDVDHVLENVTAMNPALQSPNSVLAIVRPLHRVMAQPTLLGQCLSNLLDNAVKFVDPNVVPRISIRSEQASSGRIRLWIEDNGIGMDEITQKKIFRIFERARGVADYSGTGVGLAIVAKAVERMRGAYGVESEPGKGSRFWIELAAAKP